MFKKLLPFNKEKEDVDMLLLTAKQLPDPPEEWPPANLWLGRPLSMNDHEITLDAKMLRIEVYLRVKTTGYTFRKEVLISKIAGETVLLSLKTVVCVTCPEPFTILKTAYGVYSLIKKYRELSELAQLMELYIKVTFYILERRLFPLNVSNTPFAKVLHNSNTAIVGAAFIVSFISEVLDIPVDGLSILEGAESVSEKLAEWLTKPAKRIAKNELRKFRTGMSCDTCKGQIIGDAFMCEHCTMLKCESYACETCYKQKSLVCHGDRQHPNRSSWRQVALTSVEEPDCAHFCDRCKTEEILFRYVCLECKYEVCEWCSGVFMSEEALVPRTAQRRSGPCAHSRMKSIAGLR
ncbi:hypothetical protein BJ742DRAFT_51340 [Cladochytrium replicatum]|nr:hypothetical protein BJ742DRAFT_51340 [Cladochytrium replicatum]